MEKFILDVLGPYATAFFLVPLVVVVVLRHAIRKRHIVALVAACVLGFLGFFAALLWGIAAYDGMQAVGPYQGFLRVLAGVAVASGAAVGYAFILKSFGLASLGGDAD